MCVSPGKLRDGTLIACRLCWQCRKSRINDWVGRCIAERKTALAGHMINLTYGRDEHGNEDHPRAKVLTYSDVQKYFKLLRRHGYPCRYFAVGEYGSTKGRAHWHLLVFWLKAVPPHELDKQKWREPHWPHGFSMWSEVNYASVRYVMKYISKDIGEAERQGHLSMSKKPPLGSAYFRGEAERYVEAGLAPQTLAYSFDEARDKQGRKTSFYLGGKTADIFLDHFVRIWEERRPGRSLPNSELVSEFVDRQRDIRFDGKGNEMRPESEKDHAFEREWSERIRDAERIEWARENLPIAGDWASLVGRNHGEA